MTGFVNKVYMRNWDLNCVEEENTLNTEEHDLFEITERIN